jgi:mRNA interferase MazF
MTTYEPGAGDLIWVECSPRVGREESGRRPALVVSPIAFCRASGLAIVCPITSKVRPFRSSVVLPAGLPITGEILSAHVRSIDVQFYGREMAQQALQAAEDILTIVREHYEAQGDTAILEPDQE